jgi:hypothetical protein
MYMMQAHTTPAAVTVTTHRQHCPPASRLQADAHEAVGGLVAAAIAATAIATLLAVATTCECTCTCTSSSSSSSGNVRAERRL